MSLIVTRQDHYSVKGERRDDWIYQYKRQSKLHNYTVTQMYPTTYRKEVGDQKIPLKKCVSFSTRRKSIDDWKTFQDGLVFPSLNM